MRAEALERGVEVAFAVGADLAEGPLWSASRRRLLWVDLLRGEVHESDPADGGQRVLRLDGSVGAVAERADGGLAIAWGGGYAGLDPASGTVAPWCHPEADLAG